MWGPNMKTHRIADVTGSICAGAIILGIMVLVLSDAAILLVRFALP